MDRIFIDTNDSERVGVLKNVPNSKALLVQYALNEDDAHIFHTLMESSSGTKRLLIRYSEEGYKLGETVEGIHKTDLCNLVCLEFHSDKSIDTLIEALTKLRDGNWHE